MAVFRYVNLRFTAVMAIFVDVILLPYREDVLGSLLGPLTTLTAQVTLALLHWLGMEAARVGTLISHPHGFAYEIYYRCTGFFPVAVLTVSILASPGTLRRKCIWLALGVPVLIALNLVRLVPLFFIGGFNPPPFVFAHPVLGGGCPVPAAFG